MRGAVFCCDLQQGPGGGAALAPLCPLQKCSRFRAGDPRGALHAQLVGQRERREQVGRLHLRRGGQQPLEGIALMRRRRPGLADRELTSGPGKLCAALGIDRALDGADLLGDRIWIEPAPRGAAPPRIAVKSSRARAA